MRQQELKGVCAGVLATAFWSGSAVAKHCSGALAESMPRPNAVGSVFWLGQARIRFCLLGLRRRPTRATCIGFELFAADDLHSSIVVDFPEDSRNFARSDPALEAEGLDQAHSSAFRSVDFIRHGHQGASRCQRADA